MRVILIHQQLPALALALFAVFVPGTLFSQNLAGSGHTWRVSTIDHPSNASPEIDDSRWAELHLPANVAKSGSSLELRERSAIWLRTRVRLEPGRTNLALILGEVADHDETYFNGELIGHSNASGSVATGYNLSRVYLIPDRLIRPNPDFPGEYDNVIAIRIRGNFAGSRGITGGPIRILPAIEAEREFWTAERTPLIFAAIYLVTGIFFLILYRTLGEFKEYKWFGAFAILVALQQFLVNEIRFEVADWFLAFKLIEQYCYLFIPVVFFYFFTHFFKIKKLPFTSLSPTRVAIGYGLINAVVAVLMAVLMDPVKWDRIITYWFPTNLPVFLYYIQFCMRRAVRDLDRDAIILSVGTLVMIGVTFHFYGVARGTFDGPDYFHVGLAAFYLIMAFALMYRLIDLQLEVERRRKRIDSVNVLRDRVFQYLNTFLRKPTENIGNTIRTRLNPEEADYSRASVRITVRELGSEIDQLQSNLDDILELSRLEVISDPEYLETVNFRDFITAVIPRGEITHHIKVNPDITLRTSLELVNSFVIRLIDFPAFREFRHIDLIITSDLHGHVHFRFMLFHENVRKTRQFYELLTGLNPDLGGLWVKWAIIREIIRILRGRLDVRIVNKKFLTIDIELEAHLPGDSPSSLKRKQAYIELSPTARTDVVATEASPALEVEARPQKEASRPARPLPRLHANMSVTEFIEYVRLRFLSRNR